MTTLPQTVVIIGVGLIGGSIAKAIKQSFPTPVTVIGVGQQEEHLALAKEAGIIDHIAPLTDIGSSDLAIIATPPGAVIGVLHQLEALQQPPRRIIDVASTKHTICATAGTLTIDFLGTHPMAGKEQSGSRHADAALFADKPWIICPTPQTKIGTIEPIITLITTLGAQPVILSPEEHDQLVAWVSHLPTILAPILMNVVATQPQWNMLQSIASTGLLDSTRLASGQEQMKRDILLSNSDNISEALDTVIREIQQVKMYIEQKNATALGTYLRRAKDARASWLEARVKKS